MSYKKLLKRLLVIYNPPDIDWMGNLKTEKNYYTFHHIEKKEIGGDNVVENGAILTCFSHKVLHFLEIFNKDLFNKWNELFIEINNYNAPLNGDLYFKIFTLKNETDCFIEEFNQTREEEGKSRLLYYRF